MQAPRLLKPALTHERVRCSCQTENLLVFPTAWYRGQDTVELEEACVACGKYLQPLDAPAGAVVLRSTVETLPRVVATRLGGELLDEVQRAQKVPVDDPGPVRWDEPHEASEAYVVWFAARPAPLAPIDPYHLKRNGIITAVLVVVVLAFALL